MKKFQEKYSRLPVRNKRRTKLTLIECEQGLANWLDKAKQRKNRALSSRPSERKLTPIEAAQLTELLVPKKKKKRNQEDDQEDDQEGAHLNALKFQVPDLFQEMDGVDSNDDWELDSLGSRGKPPARPGARRPPPPPTAADRPADRPIPQMRTFGEV